ncbi:ATP synthase F1 subunit epsilon [Candidatus Collierbacteria bacterium CG17_big_fil_post_rev_8_21_14_2_50_45_7]|uniref:ATP synthase epsilon chain n=2 Tax=Candidatus Collieribacteriota TaxID=1752725 RepID=A0A2M7FPJ7_9BACT|nr:MAG: ATP synthase F1 subunit epsilon [Candidatus Collierbacteria bacterium CG17_big_fil_post_rev_8_21_14_2_50_45_7]
MSKSLTLDIVTQEKKLLSDEITSLTAQTVEGEITILPQHVPFLTRLTEGVMRYTTLSGVEEVVAIFGGFLEVDSRGNISVLADSAMRAQDIDEAKVKAAELEAKSVLADKTRQLEFAQAEASLRKAYAQIKALNKGTRPRHSQT